MNSRERVAIALRREEPDRVPYCELGIDRALAQRIMGWGEPANQAADLEANVYSVEEAKAIAARLHMDNIVYVLRAPVYAHKQPGADGRLFYGEGMIKTEADLAICLTLTTMHCTLRRGRSQHKRTAFPRGW
jgi:uroporphyrinogen decarboxylase